jgi:hypothetical protein
MPSSISEAYSLGRAFMVLIFLWGAFLLSRQFQNLDRK